jgi:hypothetical protein
LIGAPGVLSAEFTVYDNGTAGSEHLDVMGSTWVKMSRVTPFVGMADLPPS